MNFPNILLHPLSYDGPLPERLNNPFDYEPHPVCEAAVRDLVPHIEKLMQGNPEGKMFGVLVVTNEKDSQTANGHPPLYYLAAFSGQLYDRTAMPGFVPPVFDFLDPDGYFKQHEAEISDLNREIAAFESDESYNQAINDYQEMTLLAEKEIAAAKERMTSAKQKRDELRQNQPLTKEQEAELVKESQFLKAEVRRVKQYWKEKLLDIQYLIDNTKDRIELLKAERRRQSETLQNWLFS